MTFQNSEYASNWNGVIPPKSQIGNLASDIAGEGYKVSEGTKGNWTPTPKQQMFPDLSKVDKIARYFNRNDFSPWPSWVYHRTEEARIVNDADEALKYGIIFREATEDERMIGQTMPRYDFIRGSEWRTQPFPGTQKFDVTKLGPGKNYEPPRPNYERAQHDMMGNLVAALQAGGGTNSSGMTPEAIAAIVAATMKAMMPQAAASDDEEDRADLISVLEQRGVKVDKRWSMERLKAEAAK